MADALSNTFATDNSQEEFDWWNSQIFTLVAGLGCGMIANLIARWFTRRQMPQPERSLLSLVPSMNNKLVMVVRTDLGMGKGKIAAQCAHAAVGCYKQGLKITPDYVRNWEAFGQTKVALKADSLELLQELKLKAESKGLPVSLIRDAGRTQIDSGTVTVLGIGPGPSELVDSVTGDLKLL